jgi:23S rRNA (guanosine2251-2'-O)-methyltransferase
VGNATTRMKKRGHGEFVVFGRRAVLEVLAQKPSDALAFDVLVSKTATSAFRSDLAKACRIAEVELRSVSAGEVSAASGEPRHDQGVAASVRLGRVTEVEPFVEAHKGKAARNPVRLLALDGVTNAQNIGMVVRSVVGCGLGGVLWPTVGSPWINGLVVKSSASAIYRCNVLRCATLVEGLGVLRAAGFKAIGLTHPSDANLFEYEVPHRAVFVVGSEALGLSAEVEAMLDVRLEIPLDSGLESLNVAVAASLACYKAAGIVTAGAASPAS